MVAPKVAPRDSLLISDYWLSKMFIAGKFDVELNFLIGGQVRRSPHIPEYSNPVQFEIADDETLAELKQKVEAIESLRSQYRSELKTYRNHIRK